MDCIILGYYLFRLPNTLMNIIFCKYYQAIVESSLII